MSSLSLSLLFSLSVLNLRSPASAPFSVHLRSSASAPQISSRSASISDTRISATQHLKSPAIAASVRRLYASSPLHRCHFKTAKIQVLKKAGRPSERLVSHENCRIQKPIMQHECVHVHEITEAAGTEEAEVEAEYDKAMKEAIKGVENAVTIINDHLEEVRYEIAALEPE